MHRFDFSSLTRHSRIRIAAVLVAIGLILFSAVAAADEFGYEAPSPGADPDQAAKQKPGDETSFTGWVEPGIGYVDGTNEGFGQYNALHSDGAYGVLNFNLWSREGGRFGDTRYWNASGRDLGTGSGDFSAEAGDQGDYRLRIGFRQIERLDKENAISVFLRGDNRLVLPSGYTVPGDADDRSFYRDADLGVKRQELSLGFEKVLSEYWALITDFRFEDKHGDKPTGVGQGFLGTALGVQRIDYRHTQIDLLLRHLEPGYHLEFGYYFSYFDNSARALNFENPKFNAGTQQLALPPDSLFHQLRASGGLTLTDTARMTGHAAFGRATQDETFLPYSTADFYDFNGSAPGNGTPPPYPRNSLDGKADHINLQLSLFNRLTSKLNTELSYKYEDRDNQTPLGVYRHLHFNGEADEEWGNRANSRERHTFAAEGKWRLPKRLRLKLGYQHQRTFRDTRLIESENQQRALTHYDHETREDNLWTQLRVPVSNRLAGKIKVSGGQRSTSSSQEFDVHIAEHETVAPSYLLDRKRVGIETSANWQARSDLMVSASWQLARERFRNTTFGPEEVTSRSGNLNFSYDPSPQLNTNVFLGVESHLMSQNSREDRSFPSMVKDRWTVKVDDHAYHAGLGIDWKPDHERFGVGFDYSFLDAENAVSSAHAVDGKDRLPDTDFRIHRVSLEAEVPLEEQLTLTAGYRYHRYDTQNWSWSLEDYSELGFGWSNPNGSAHALLLGARFQF